MAQGRREEAQKLGREKEREGCWGEEGAVCEEELTQSQNCPTKPNQMHEWQCKNVNVSFLLRRIIIIDNRGLGGQRRLAW